ncbi:MAG: hypothetical protein ACI4A5_05730 [Hominilimicola sp.]
MSIFGKKKAIKIPDGFTLEDIKIESSICTGEKTIGFFDMKSGKLAYAELVRNDEDIAAFYTKYGLNEVEANER